MKAMLINFRLSVILSSLIILPFILLELATQSNSPGSQLSMPGYVIMWLCPMAFVFILMPIIQSMRAGNTLMVARAARIALLLRVILLPLLAWMWGTFMLDQLPCFLGANGC